MSQKIMYFQYLSYPIYTCVPQGDLELEDIVSNYGFHACDKEPRLNESGSTLIKLSHANKDITQKINYVYGDKGEESYLRAQNSYIYRSKGSAMFVFHPKLSFWELAIVKGAPVEILKKVWGQVLHQALLKLDVLCFWGVKLQDQIVISSCSVSEADQVAIDLDKGEFILNHEVQKLDTQCTFVKLDMSSLSKQRQISKEEFYSFLIFRLAYFELSHKMSSLQVKLMGLVKMFQAKQYPYKDFSIQRESKIEETLASSSLGM